jgi:hypothetical protein
MSQIVCFIDKIGMPGTCGVEASGQATIGCKKCSFYKTYKGKERKEFIYALWTGELDKIKRKKRKNAGKQSKRVES